jgi:ankyrin repeat protein
MMSGNKGNTALHFAICYETNTHFQKPAACAGSDIDTVTAKLHLSNVDLQVVNDNTTLHWACYRGHMEIVRMLLSAFADTHITEDNRRTPAMLAE